MCQASVIEFFLESVRPEHFRGKRVLEVGSRSVNGSVRPIITRFCEPAEYIGVDLFPGKFVDQVAEVDQLLRIFGPSSFDAVVSTELLEHVRDWKAAISNLKGVLREGGHIYLTTRSIGFPFHGYPYDYWRYEIEDMERIFRDHRMISLARDPHVPGVFLVALKQSGQPAVDLDRIELYSMMTGRKTREIPSRMTFGRWFKFGLLMNSGQVAFSSFDATLQRFFG